MTNPTRAAIAATLKAACTPISALMSDLNELKSLHIKAKALQDAITADPDLAVSVDVDALDRSLTALAIQLIQLEAVVTELRSGGTSEADSRVA